LVGHGRVSLVTPEELAQTRRKRVEVAQVEMGHLGAGWLERPEREQEERTDLLGGVVDGSFQNINAVIQHINAGKLRRQDCFDQLVDPQRSIPAAGIPIHGITPERVAGQPVIATVLPAFHAFAADTVLVAHNAAFDMRFLQLLEAETGIVFNQPVLDTLLLSAVVHPQQESHRLEAIAERLGVPVLGRHTALGDAMVTAEVFLKLVPLLEAMGIRTLGEALAAAQKTYFARVTY
jgi:DNA polymerase-3 subunit epsilon